MIVYVESNFVLEIAYEQEEARYAKEILTLASNGVIKLAFSSFILSEPFESVLRRQSERNVALNSLEKTLRELQRSEPHKEIMLDIDPVINTIKGATAREFDLLYLAFEDLLAHGSCIVVDATMIRECRRYQLNFGLSEKDSIIYSSIIADLKAKTTEENKCFLSRDSEAFNNSSVKSELSLYKCRYIKTFRDGLQFIKSKI